MLLSGPLLLAERECVLCAGVMSDGFSGLPASATLARRWATAGMVLAALSLCAYGSGVGGADSPRTAVVGRKRDAMTTRWLRKEDMKRRGLGELDLLLYLQTDVTIDDAPFPFWARISCAFGTAHPAHGHLKWAGSVGFLLLASATPVLVLL